MKSLPTLFLAGILLLTMGCQQEGFILLRNLDRAEWISVESILQQSGLSQPVTNVPTNRISRRASAPPQAVSLPQETKHMTIPPNKEFIIQFSERDTLIALKSVRGVTHLRENSDPSQKLFAFHSHTSNGRAHFQHYDLDGRLQKNVFYYFQIQAPTAPQPPPTIPLARIPPVATATNGAETNITNLPPVAQNVDWLLSSIRRLPPSEAIQNLESATASDVFTDSEKEQLNYVLIEHYIQQRLLTRASNRIEILTAPARQAYYRGLHAEALRRPADALRFLLNAIDLGGEVLPQAIVAAGRIMINSGVSDASLTARLDNLTRGITDSELAATSMIQLAQLYEALRNLTRARELYTTVITGNHPAPLRERARRQLSTLDQQFR